MESKLYQRKRNIYDKEYLIIGTSDYGPTNAIVNVKNEVDVKSIFGKGGSLYKSYIQIKDTLKEGISVNLIKITGSHACANFNLNQQNNEIASNSLMLTSIYSNEIYNQVVVRLYSDRIEFEFPSLFNLENAVYYYNDYEVVGHLVNAINEDTYNAKNVVIANCSVNEYTPFDSSFYVINESITILSGGDSGLNLTNEQVYKCLDKTYDIILGENIHLITITNVFVDDEVNIRYESGRRCTFYEQLLSFLATQLKYGVVTVGFITFSDRLIFGKDVAQNIKLILKKCKTNEYLDKYSFLISIPYGDLYIDYKSYHSNPLMFYSNIYLNLSENTNTTNKYINDSFAIKDYLNEEQIKTLNELGVVTFRHSPYYDKVVVCNGVTCVTSETDFKYIVNVFMVQTIMPVLKSELTKHLGEDIKSVVENNIIKEDVRKVLIGFATRDIVDKYEFDLSANYKKGELICNLSLKSAYMLEDIKLVGKINFEQLEEV